MNEGGMNEGPGTTGVLKGDELQQVRNLIARCMDGVASDREVAELDGLVGRNPQVARELALAARFESTLEVVMRAGPEESAAPPMTGLESSAWLHGRLPRVAAAGIAVAAAAVVVTWSVFTRQPEGTNNRGKDTDVAAAVPVPVAPVRSGTTSQGGEEQPSHHRRRLHFIDGSVADLRDDDSRIETRVAAARAVEVALIAGGARFEVVHRPDRRFRIWVASASYVDVIGTVFTVDRLAAGVRVSVERGTVRVVSGQNELRLSGGGTHVVPLETWDMRTSDRPRTRTQQRTNEPGGTTTAAEDKAGALLRASKEARKEGRPEQALVLLRRFLVLHGGDPRAPYAAFITGRVLLEELARPREAAAAFAGVEALDPTTPLVEDALAREVESWSRAGDAAKAGQRAREFLRRYPQGPRGDEVRRFGRME